MKTFLKSAGVMTAEECANPALLAAVRKQCGLRRTDRFTAILLGAALRALEGIRLPDGAETGLVTATVSGPRHTEELFLDDLLDLPEEEVTPTLFANSVRNAAGSYLSTVFDIRGPCMTLTGAEPFETAVDAARMLLERGACRAVLVVFGEEDSLRTCALRKIRPGIPAEGALAFLLEGEWKMPTDSMRRTL